MINRVMGKWKKAFYHCYCCNAVFQSASFVSQQSSLLSTTKVIRERLHFVLILLEVFSHRPKTSRLGYMVTPNHPYFHICDCYCTSSLYVGPLMKWRCVQAHTMTAPWQAPVIAAIKSEWIDRQSGRVAKIANFLPNSTFSIFKDLGATKGRCRNEPSIQTNWQLILLQLAIKP